MKDFFKFYIKIHFIKKNRYIYSFFLGILGIIPASLSLLLWVDDSGQTYNYIPVHIINILSVTMFITIYLSVLMIPIWKINREVAYVYSIKNNETKLKKYKFLANLISLAIFIVIIFTVSLILSLLWGQF